MSQWLQCTAREKKSSSRPPADKSRPRPVCSTPCAIWAVSDRVAGDMLARYGQPYLWRKVRQTRYARRTGIAVKPAGWFIASVRENWRAPAGFDEWAELDADERREALRVSWGVCRRCGRRPCHCEERDQVEDGQDDESETEMDQSAGQIAPQDGFVSGQPG